MEADSVVNSVNPEYVMVRRRVLEELLDSLGSADLLPQPSYDDFDPAVLLVEFKEACEIDYRLDPSTVRERTRHVGRLLEFLGKHPLLATRQELRQFLRFDPAQNAVKAIRLLYGRFFESELASCFKCPQSPPRMIISPKRGQLRQNYDSLHDPELEAAFLLFASSGLRRHEGMELIWSRLDMENRIVYPGRQTSTTKFQWVTCFNHEAKMALEKLYSIRSPGPDERVFTLAKDTLTRKFREASPPDFKITPQILRDWFCNEMGRRGVQDRYVDAFCGRIPRKVLGRHYTDYSPENLKEIYDKANLRVFEQDLIAEDARAGVEVKG